MIIKSFTAETMAAALKEVKTEMGKDAVVLNTRQLTPGTGNGRVEVTACCEASTSDDPKTASQPARTPRQATPVNRRVQPAVFRRHDKPGVHKNSHTPSTALREEEQKDMMMLQQSLIRIEDQLSALAMSVQAAQSNQSEEAPVRRTLRERLRAQDFSDRCVGVIMQEIDELRADFATDEEAIAAGLRSFFARHTHPAPTFDIGDTVLFIGPAGCGKTSALGKLAADLTLVKKRPVRLTALESGKVGAVDELQSYTDILATVTETKPEPTPTDVITLIDSPALPVDDKTIRAWAKKSESMEACCRLAVISARLRTSDLAPVCERLRALKPTHLLATMTDLTSCWGGIFEVATALSIPLSLLADAPSGVGRLSAPDIDTLAAELLPEEVRL